MEGDGQMDVCLWFVLQLHHVENQRLTESL